MRSWFTCLLLLGMAASLHAKVYYINKGVKYHVGDNTYSRSVDSDFMDSHPVVGQEWIQAFRVDQPDKVQVRIEKIWGVDDCPYCKILITVNDYKMGRLFEENNHQPFITPDPLAVHVQPGTIYYLKIASYGQGRIDDFVMENVVVETSGASIQFLDPGPIIKMANDPMPLVSLPQLAAAPHGACQASRRVDNWQSSSRGVLKLESVGSKKHHDTRVAVRPGDYLDAWLRVTGVMPGDLVGQSVEVLVGGDKGSGFVLSFVPGRDRLSHANIKKRGVYRKGGFDTAAYKPFGWNRLRLARCLSGELVLDLNGVELGRVAAGAGENTDLGFQVLGINAEIAVKPY